MAWIYQPDRFERSVLAKMRRWLFTCKGALAALVFVLGLVGGAFVWMQREPAPKSSAEQLEKIMTSLAGKFPAPGGGVQFLGAENAQKEALRSAVRALQAASIAETPGPGVDAALVTLQRGDISKAEALFRKMRKRKRTDAKEGSPRAAEASRHLSALAFLHDTKAALAASEDAVKLNPNSAEGWHQLGYQLRSAGKLSEAERAYSRLQDIGTGDDWWTVIALGNLGPQCRAGARLSDLATSCPTRQR